MKEKCDITLVVERYGGGPRFYCPVCDLLKNNYGISVVRWTNAPASVGDKCQNIREKVKLK